MRLLAAWLCANPVLCTRDCIETGDGVPGDVERLDELVV
jgi:hypothetical protein